MYIDTMKLFVLSIGTVVVVHLLINMLVEKHAMDRERRCIRQIRRRRRVKRASLGRRRRPGSSRAGRGATGADESGGESDDDLAGGRALAPSHGSGSGSGSGRDSDADGTTDMEDLKIELSEWMRREHPEAMPPSAAESPTADVRGGGGARATSLDEIFEHQQVDMATIKMPEQTSTHAPDRNVPLTMATVETEPTTEVAVSRPGYNNSTMNGGELGNGLFAWDNMECTYANVK